MYDRSGRQQPWRAEPRERFGLGTSLPVVGQSNSSAKEAKQSLWRARNQTGDYGQREESTGFHGVSAGSSVFYPYI